MVFGRLLYFFALSGALAGLAAWVADALLGVVIETSRAAWVADVLAVFLLSVVLAPLLFTGLDRVSGRPFRWTAIGTGIAVAVLSTFAGSLVLWFLRERLATESPLLYSLSAWSLSASILGLGIGLRWVRSNRMRILHTYTGGLGGGLLAGLFFVGLGPRLPELCQATGLMLTGAGIGLGSALAPLLIGDGALQFISSADARAQSKYGRVHKFWELKHEETYVVGSLATLHSETRFQPGADIFIPDAAMAPRHAVIFSKEGRFFVARHPDAGGPAGIAKYVLRTRGKTIVASQELTEADDLLIGRTALRFTAKGQSE